MGCLWCAGAGTWACRTSPRSAILSSLSNRAWSRSPSSMGFDAQYVGDITCSRYIEPMAEVLIHLTYIQNQDTDIALKLRHA